MGVVTILPGIVHSKLHSHDVADIELPPTSRYVAIKDIIARWASGEVQPQDGTSVEKFAELVEKDIIGTGKASGGLQSRGAYAAMMRRIAQYAPVGVSVGICTHPVRLKDLADIFVLKGLHILSEPGPQGARAESQSGEEDLTITTASAGIGRHSRQRHLDGTVPT